MDEKVKKLAELLCRMPDTKQAITLAFTQGVELGQMLPKETLVPTDPPATEPKREGAA